MHGAFFMDTMKSDFLIVGRGIAGAILSLQLAERGINHHIIDAPGFSSSSRVAAGIVNPVVLKRLKLVSGAPQYLNQALSFYKNLEEKHGQLFFHPTPIAHIFQSVGELNNWYEKQDNPSFKPYLGEVKSNTTNAIPAPNGLGLMKTTGWLDTIALLDFHKTLMADVIINRNQLLTHEELLNISTSYKHVVLCSGHLMRHFYSNYEEIFLPTRGEVIVIETNDLPEDHIIHGPVFILPLGNNKFKVGATYHWDGLKDVPTEEGLDKLKRDLGKIFTGTYQIIDHQAGVRPNTQDQKPLLGHIQNNIYLLNGLGSRGVLMAPLLANQILDYILENTPLDSSIDVKRFT